MNDLRRRRAHVVRLLPILGLLAVLATSGCASAPRSDATGGAEIELFVTREANSFARYWVEPNGRLHFSGGVDAILSKYTWGGMMTDVELATLRGLLAEHDDYREKPVATDRLMSNREYTLKMRTPRGSWRHTVTGSCPALDQLYDLLETAARRRNEGVVERITPGPQN